MILQNHKTKHQPERARLLAVAVGFCAVAAAGGCAVPGDLGETDDGAQMSEDVGVAEQALNTCTVTSYLCGKDGLAGDANTLYRCGGSGQAATDAILCASTCAIKANANDWCNLGAGSTVVASPTVMNLLAQGTYDSTSKILQWTGGGSGLPLRPVQIGTGTRVPGPTGTGWCTDFVFMATGRKNDVTSHWKKGIQVVANIVKKGTAVAFFNGASSYPSDGTGHVAILAADVAAGAASITLYDQNFATPLDYVVRKHSLSKTNTGKVGDAGAYYVINWQ